MDFSATDYKVPLLSSLMSIASRYFLEMRDSPFTKKGGGTKNFRFKSHHLGVLLYHLYIWTMLVRVVCTAVTLNTGGALLPGYLAHVDLLMAFFVRVHFIDGHLAMIGWPSIILGAVLDLTARFIRQTYCYRLVFDLLITNKQNFFYLNPQLVVRGWRGVPNLYRKLVQKYDEAEKSAVLVLGCHKLLYFPYLNRSVRLRAVALSFTFDLITAVTSFVFGLEALVTVLYYTLKYFRFWYDSLLQQVVITLDLAMMSYMVWHSIQISFVLIHGVYLVLYVHVAQQRSLNRLLDSFTVKMMRKKEEEEKLMMLTNLLTSSSSHSTSITAGTTMKRAIETLDSRRRRGSSQNQISGSINRNSNHHNIGSYFLLPSYLRSHLRFTRDLLKTNRELFSPLLFLTLVTLFAGNVYSGNTFFCTKFFKNFLKIFDFDFEYFSYFSDDDRPQPAAQLHGKQPAAVDQRFK